jgi:GNAT superfamily N-acetyltransferase
MLVKQQVQIRPVEPYQAAHVVDAVFAGLSAESRRLRFHVPMPRLPTSFRDQLARLDGRNHAAVAAWVGSDVVGVGRLVAISATDCEMALAVADDWQGRGVGRSILGELTGVALGFGFEQLIADVLAENSAMLRLIGDVFPDAACTRSRGVIHVTCQLATAQSEASAVPLRRTPQLCG